MRHPGDSEDAEIAMRLEPAWQCNVLVADDDEVSRTQLVSLLKLSGYEARGVCSGADALRAISDSPCQIVVMNWDMPDIDGPALCRHLRVLEARDGVYVLMLTGEADQSGILSGLEAGADDYLTRGAATEEVLARMGIARRITRLETALRRSDRENQLLAMVDSLTGARNRAYLMKHLPRELERSRRYGHPLAVLSCDIDGFNRINEGFGHDTGDEVLQTFVARCSASLREATDWIARTSGKGFVVVLPETNLGGARTVADKLRRALATQSIATRSGPLTITASIGVTAVETAEELARISIVDLLRTADRCLYVSKNLGSDRATAASTTQIGTLMHYALAGNRNEIN